MVRIWRAQVLNDLDAILDNISKDLEYYAMITVQKTFSAVKQYPPYFSEIKYIPT